MGQVLHQRATTTDEVRAAIQRSSASIHQRCELEPAGAELVGDVSPGLDDCLPVGMVEDLAYGGGYDRMLALGHMGERVSDPVNAASFPGRLEDPARCGP